MKSGTLLAIVLLALLLQGCYLGPTILEEVKVSRPSASTSGKTLIASRIMTSQRTVETQTGGAGVTRILETATVNDAAPDLADRLSERGITIHYRAGFARSSLEEDQLLLTGKILPGTPNPLFNGGGARVTSSWVHLITGIAALYILPFPIPIFTYLEVEYDVRLLDSEGVMVARASGRTLLSFRHHVTLSAFNWRGDPELYKRGMPAFLDALADELAEKLR